MMRRVGGGGDAGREMDGYVRAKREQIVYTLDFILIFLFIYTFNTPLLILLITPPQGLIRTNAHCYSVPGFTNDLFPFLFPT